MLPVIIAATEDKSWRVRLALSKNFADLTEAFGKEITDMSLIQIYTTLLRDVECEVKTASINSLQYFIKQISPDRLQIIMPHLNFLMKDGPGVKGNIKYLIISVNIKKFSNSNQYKSLKFGALELILK